MPVAPVPNPPWLPGTWLDTSWEAGTWGDVVAADLPLFICFADIAVATPRIDGVTVALPRVTDVSVEVC